MNKKDDILKVAEWAISQTRKIIPHSTHYPHETENHHQKLILNLVRYQPLNIFDELFYEEIASWHLDLSSQQKHPLADYKYNIPYLNRYLSVEEIQERLTHMQPTNTFHTGFRRYEMVAQQALRFGIGNRLEVSVYAFLLLLEYPCENPPSGLPRLDNNIRIEFVRFVKNEEYFVCILNRMEGEINNLFSWNDDTIICDPLTFECFTKEAVMSASPQKMWNIYAMFQEGAEKDRTFPEREDVFVGMNHDLKLYSSDWSKKIYYTSIKYWQPQRLIDIKDREAFTFKEALPNTRFSILKYMLLKKLNEEHITALKIFFSNNKTQQIEGVPFIIFFAKKERWDIVSIFVDEPMGEEKKAEYQELLSLVVQANQRELAIRLVKANINIHFCSNRYEGSNNPLHYAVHINDGELLTALLKTAPLQSCMQKNNLNETPIVTAARFGKWNLVKLFLEHYPITNEQYDGEYDKVLLYAMHLHQQEIALMLLPSRTQINYYVTETGDNLLHYAVFHKDTYLLLALLNKDFRLAHQKNKNNETPFELAQRTDPVAVSLFEFSESERKKNIRVTPILQKIGSPIFSEEVSQKISENNERLEYK